MAGLFLASTLLFFPTQADAAKPHANKVKQTAKPIWTLAMDGPRVAYMRNDRRVAVWNVITGATSTIKGTYPSNGKFGQGRGEVAIAGKRIALITRFVTGNSQQTQERLYTAPLGGSARQLGKRTNHATDPQCFDCGDPGFSTGSWIAGLAGSGKVLAVSAWKSNDSVSSGERLSLVAPQGLRTIAAGPGAIVAESVSGGRIAVLRSTEAWPADGVGPATTAPTVGIYSAAGALLREIAPSSAREVALSGNRLVVLTETNTLEVYDPTTGAPMETWPLVAGPRQEGGHLAVYGRLAVYSVDPRRAAPRKLHLLDLTTGKDVVIARAIGSGYNSRDAAIGSSGLVYAVDSGGRHPKGKLVFVPMAKLLRLVGG